jgi:uncharacterized protein (DUF3820 family)
MSAPSKIVQTYYVSTGRKNAMYTLRARRDCIGQAAHMFEFMPDFYVCNLAADEERAIEKAADYVEAFRERVGETEDFKIVFDASGADREAYKRRGKLSVKDTFKIERIESGVIPFGKYADKNFSEAPDSYILYWVDKSREEITDPIIGAIIAVCQGIAAEKGLIAKRDAAREARHAADIKSNYIGTIGKRQDFTGVLEYLSGPNEGTYGVWHTNKVRIGDDIVIYFGAPLGEQGETITFRATVKAHKEKDGVKSTQVNRPAK